MNLNLGVVTLKQELILLSIQQILGKDKLEIFETLWAKDNLERLEKIQELHQEKILKMKVGINNG